MSADLCPEKCDPCDACSAGVCSWCGHDDCPDPAHGLAPDHGERGPCLGCSTCDDEDDDP